MYNVKSLKKTFFILVVCLVGVLVAQNYLRSAVHKIEINEQKSVK